MSTIARDSTLAINASPSWQVTCSLSLSRSLSLSLSLTLSPLTLSFSLSLSPLSLSFSHNACYLFVWVGGFIVTN
jgi:hypothetical protein